MENWGSSSGERQQGVCDLPKGGGPTPFSFSPFFPGFLITPPSPSPQSAAHPGLGNRTSEAGELSRAQKSFPGHSRHQKNQNIAPSSSCWITPGSFAPRSSPYLEATPSLLPSPCSTGEINVYFCARLLPVPHVLPGK